MGNSPGLDDVLPCFEVPPEIRIGDGLSGKGKDQEHKDQSEQFASRQEHVDKSSP